MLLLMAFGETHGTGIAKRECAGVPAMTVTLMKTHWPIQVAKRDSRGGMTWTMASWFM